MQPSLLVLIVGGWAQDALGPNNLFTAHEQGLSDLLDRFPTLFIRQLEGMPKLWRIYEQMGTLAVQDKTSLSLTEILTSHGLRQVFLADADRYGLLTQAFNGGQKQLREGQLATYVPLPPGERLNQTPASSTPFLVDSVSQALSYDQDTVIFACFDAIWTMAMTKSLDATRQAIRAVEQAVSTVVSKALERSIPVLLLGDEGIAESYVLPQQLTIQAEPTDHPIPCALIHPRLEGLRSGQSDQSEAMESGRVVANATWADIAPTILALMDMARPQSAGQVLFAEQIKRLRAK